MTQITWPCIAKMFKNKEETSATIVYLILNFQYCNQNILVCLFMAWLADNMVASPHCIWLKKASNFSSLLGLFYDNMVLQLQETCKLHFQLQATYSDLSFSVLQPNSFKKDISTALCRPLSPDQCCPNFRITFKLSSSDFEMGRVVKNEMYLFITWARECFIKNTIFGWVFHQFCNWL